MEKFLNLDFFGHLCPTVETSKIGLIYIFLPARSQSDYFTSKGTNETRLIFRLNHYFSLLAMTKLFKSSSRDRLLFYYVNEKNRPQSNHYNQWLNDSYWRSRLPFDSIRMLNLEYDYENYDFDMYEIVSRVRRDYSKRFDRVKDKYILVTSDVIVGPKVQLCFTQDIDESKSQSSSININSIRSKTSSECYAALRPNSTANFYSLVYKLEMTHRDHNDFSGIIVWNNEFNSTFTESSLVDSTPYNIYKCHYRQDIIPVSTKNIPNSEYSQTYCIFGYESAMYESPILQSIFASTNNYFAMLMRKWLYGSSSPIVYKKSEEPNIPNVVHLIWFGQKFKGLKFIEYLCLKSILYVLNPDKVRIHGDVEPAECDLWNRMKRNPKIEWVHLERPIFRYFIKL